MRFRKKLELMVPLLVLLLSSAAANAATDLDAVRACSDAIATSIAENQGETVKVRIDQTYIDTKRSLGQFTLFNIDVMDSATDEVIGRFDCTVSRRANVRSLQVLPLDAPPAARRSRG
jgi:hypothetical protein